jgi:hypothetical protein
VRSDVSWHVLDNMDVFFVVLFPFGRNAPHTQHALYFDMADCVFRLTYSCTRRHSILLAMAIEPHVDG